jgi:head-tail adaptor
MSDSAVLNPGELRHQITYQRRNVAGQNAIGEDVLGTPAWSIVSTCRARVVAEGGRELTLARVRFAEAEYVIRHQYVAGLSTDLRISWYVAGQVKTLDVLHIADDNGLGRTLTVFAKDFS